MKEKKEQGFNTRGSSITLDAQEEELSIETDWEVAEENNASIDLSSKSGKASLWLTMNQLAALRDCCQKILDAHKAIEETKKRLLVPIRAF